MLLFNAEFNFLLFDVSNTYSLFFVATIKKCYKTLHF